MILYFADKNFKILGTASTSLSGGYVITDDTKKEEVETGVATLDCTVAYTDGTRSNIESWCRAGNYVLAYYGKETAADMDIVNLFMITTTELSVLDHTIKFESEDSGLDLLNNLAKEYTGTEEMSAANYINKFLEKTGFRLRNNNVSKNPKKLEWTSTDTVTKRLADIAEKFEIELTYGFSVKGLTVSDRWVDIADETGRDTKINLYIDKEVNNITVKNTIENLATALYATGKDNLTLIGFTIPEADKDKYKIDPDGNLVSLEALTKWARVDYSSKDSFSGNLYQKFESSDTASQADLYKLAKEKLDSISDIETNYEVDIADLPPGVGIGDRVNIVDDAGNTYISGRILELETSGTDGTKKATLGEYVIKDSGISELVESLASSFANLSKVRELYTWIAYADTIDGDGFSFSPEGKAYLGTAANQLTEEAGTDPAVYKWVKTKGEQGEQGIPGEKGQPGAPGEKGDPGEDGYSPTVDLSTGESGSTVLTVTNKTGLSSTELKDQTARNDASDARNYADNYINSDDTGTMIASEPIKPAAATTNNVLITDKDVQVRNGQKVLASYGKTVVIGNEEGNSLHVSSSGIDMMDTGESLIKISRNDEKAPEQTNDLVKVIYDDASETYIARSTYMVGETITEDDVELYGFEYNIDDMPSSGSRRVKIRQHEYGMEYKLLTDGKHIVVTMDKNAWMSWCEGALQVQDAAELATIKILMVYSRMHNGAMLTMGKRSSDEQFDQMQGENSISIGEENVAGDKSVVLGEFSDATNTSLAVGTKNSASGASIAVGDEASASGASAAIGYKVHTSEACQLVIGERNNSATSLQDDSAAFIVGNGKDPLVVEFSEPSNAAVLTKNGHLRLAGDVYVGCEYDSTGGTPLGTVTSGTGTAKATDGRIEMQPNWWRCGNIVQLEFSVVATAAVNPGKNLATGTITGIPRPIASTGLRSVSYYGDNANVSFVSKTGGFTVRNCGSDVLAKGNNAIGNFTYITDGTML